MVKLRCRVFNINANDMLSPQVFTYRFYFRVVAEMQKWLRIINSSEHTVENNNEKLVDFHLFA